MNFEAATHRQPVRECREIAKTLHCNIYRENQQSSISSASHLIPHPFNFLYSSITFPFRFIMLERGEKQ